MRAEVTYGLDVDRVGDAEPPIHRLRRRLSGRYPVDAFGADPMLDDIVSSGAGQLVSVEVEGAGRIPEIGPAVLVTSRRPGVSDARVLWVAVRHVRRRRARLVGYRDLPGAGGVARRLGAVRARGEDLAAVLREGYLAIVPLTPSWRPGRAGHAVPSVMWGAVGYPVLPVAVSGGLVSRFGVGLGHHRVVVGSPLDVDGVPGDPLAAAELAEHARDGVQALLGAW